ncbi:MAG: hypothetical protein R3F49_19680 [Planctomycetota bacterium]
MRIAVLHLAPLTPDTSIPAGVSGPAGASAPDRAAAVAQASLDDLASAQRLNADIAHEIGLGRALARRGHVVHVLALDHDVPSELLPAYVHEWRAFGKPATLAGPPSPFNLHIVRPGVELTDVDAADLEGRPLAEPARSDAQSEPRALDDEAQGGPGGLIERFADTVRPDLVIVQLRSGHADLGRRLAARAGALLALQIPPHAGCDAERDERQRALAAAQLVLAPSAHAFATLDRWLAADDAGADAHTAVAALGAPERVLFAPGIDTQLVAPEPRGALPPVPAPPLKEGLRCVLFDGDADHDPLGRALFRASADFLVRRLDLALVLPSSGALASEIHARGGATRARVVSVDPRALGTRATLRRHARLVVLGEEAGERSALRVLECVALGVLPMARDTGPVGEALARLAPHLPPEVAAALSIPALEACDTDEVRRRVTLILEHPEVPYLGARLAALAAREFDWSIRAHELERVLDRLRPSVARSA